MSTPKKLELYYYDWCPFCSMVLRVIDSLKIKVTYKNTLENSTYAQELLKTTGRKTVPCLFIDGKAMFESRDIISWLEENQNSLEKC